MSKWLTSDTHFNHKSIIDYCDRPFRMLDGQMDIHGMNAELIRRWNEVVSPDDTVYHLGDFGFGPWESLASIRKSLHGKIIFIRGNHDGSITRCRRIGFDEVHDHLWVRGVHLSHQPPTEHELTNARRFLCGHVHNLWCDWKHVSNVGVDVRDFRPVRFSDLEFPPEEAPPTEIVG